MIFEYVRNKYGHRLGIVCAIEKKDIGWSLCQKQDEFNKDFGLMIAKGRAIKSKINDKKIPRSIYPLVLKMRERAKRYYK